MQSNNFSSPIVKKPWGWETVIFTSPDVMISFLFMKANASTSLHCHPNKRTGYVVLAGEVEVEFLAGNKRYVKGDRVNFRPSLFHRTKALGEDAFILELESPPDKLDLVRLEDPSGRKDSRYETSLASVNDKDSILIKSLVDIFHGVNESHLLDFKVSAKFQVTTPKKILAEFNDDTIVSPLNGAIRVHQFVSNQGGSSIVAPGDVTYVSHLRRMAPILNIDEPVSMLTLNFD